MTYRQHLACLTGGNWPDVYHVGKGSINIIEKKGISLLDKETTIPYFEISSITSRKSFLGWILGYRTLIIFNEEKEIELRYIPIEMIRELTNCLNEKQ